jgi:hypothetical protein
LHRGGVESGSHTLPSRHRSPLVAYPTSPQVTQSSLLPRGTQTWLAPGQFFTSVLSQSQWVVPGG